MTADAQFGVARILRPYPTFATVYQGESANIPIMFTEGGIELDKAAGHPGYSPALLKGLGVPFGARMTLWLPAINALGAGLNRIPYDWQITWRLRNVFDYRTQRIPFHYPKQGAGVPDTSTPGAEARVVIPAAHHTIGVNGTTDIDTPADQVEVQLRVENAGTATPGLFSRPLLSDGSGSGQYQQGILPIGAAAATVPIFMAHEVACFGDEMLLGVVRSIEDEPTWGFAMGEPDLFFNQFFGDTDGVFPDVGVYVQVGMMA